METETLTDRTTGMTAQYISVGDGSEIWKVKKTLTDMGAKRVGGLGPDAHWSVPVEIHEAALAVISAGVENRPRYGFGGSYGDGD